MQGRPISTEPIAEQHSHCLRSRGCLMTSTAAKLRDTLAAEASQRVEDKHNPAARGESMLMAS